MSDHYFIYTVTGGHEVFYAAIDRATGRVWTAPTKEVAHGLAQEAGLKTFTERVISKDNLLESLGIEHDHPMRIEPDKNSHERPANAPAPSKTPWFVAGEGGDDGGSGTEKLPFLPSMKGRKKSGRSNKGQSPFTANQPITPPGAGPEKTDDVLIVPASDHSPGASTPFTDKPAVDPDLPVE